MNFESARQFLNENGLYLLGTQMVSYPATVLRNRLISRKFGVKKISIGARFYLRGLSSIEMGEDFSAGEGLWLHAVTQYGKQRFSPRIVIGNRVCLSQWVHIAATNYVEIGDDVLIGSKVIITDHNHGQYSRDHTAPDVPPVLRPLDRDRRVVIGRRVWLADGVVVTPGSMIGEGSVIGANSVVKGNIPPFVIAAGVPAEIAKAFDFQRKQWIDVE